MIDTESENVNDRQLLEETCKREIEQARHKLLDLTKRNPLISFSHDNNRGKKVHLRAVNTTMSSLMRTLVTERKPLRIISLPPLHDTSEESMEEAPLLSMKQDSTVIPHKKHTPSLQDIKQHALRYQIRPDAQLIYKESDIVPREEQEDVFQTLLLPDEFEARLKKIRNEVRQAQEEKGVPILYLALGFLHWKNSQSSEEVIESPLLLLPVSLSYDLKNGTPYYKIETEGEQPIINLALSKVLYDSFNVRLPDWQDNMEVFSYVEEVANILCAGRAGWAVKFYATLGLFPFERLAMFRDLDAKNWKKPIEQHPGLLKILAGDRYEIADKDREREYDLDSDGILKKTPYIFLDADSSQHSAILDSLSGDDLVIQGPPGTGKSQTITNIIITSLFEGKKILFVAEKQAALQVVGDRLADIGLEDFCLNLHSNEKTKRHILNSIKNRLERSRHYPGNKEAQNVEERYDEEINKLGKKILILNDYKKRMNEYIGNSHLKISDAIWSYNNFHDKMKECIKDNTLPDMESPEELDKDKRDSIKNKLNSFEKSINILTQDEHDLQSHPWAGVMNENISALDEDLIRSSINNILKKIQKCCDLARNLSISGLDIDTSLEELQRRLIACSSIKIDVNYPAALYLALSHEDIRNVFMDWLPYFENTKRLYLDISRWCTLDIAKSPQPLLTDMTEAKKCFQSLPISPDTTLSFIRDYINKSKFLVDELEQLEQTSHDAAALLNVDTPHTWDDLSNLLQIAKKVSGKLLEYKETWQSISQKIRVNEESSFRSLISHFEYLYTSLQSVSSKLDLAGLADHLNRYDKLIRHFVTLQEILPKGDDAAKFLGGNPPKTWGDYRNIYKKVESILSNCKKIRRNLSDFDKFGLKFNVPSFSILENTLGSLLPITEDLPKNLTLSNARQWFHEQQNLIKEISAYRENLTTLCEEISLPIMPQTPRDAEALQTAYHLLNELPEEAAQAMTPALRKGDAREHLEKMEKEQAELQEASEKFNDTFYMENLPPPDSLHKAASTLRNANDWFWWLSTSVRQVRKQHHQLCRTASTLTNKEVANELEELAKHLSRIESFTKNETYHKLCGTKNIDIKDNFCKYSIALEWISSVKKKLDNFGQFGLELRRLLLQASPDEMENIKAGIQNIPTCPYKIPEGKQHKFSSLDKKIEQDKDNIKKIISELSPIFSCYDFHLTEIPSLLSCTQDLRRHIELTKLSMPGTEPPLPDTELARCTIEGWLEPVETTLRPFYEKLQSLHGISDPEQPFSYPEANIEFTDSCNEPQNKKDFIQKSLGSSQNISLDNHLTLTEISELSEEISNYILMPQQLELKEPEFPFTLQNALKWARDVHSLVQEASNHHTALSTPNDIFEIPSPNDYLVNFIDAIKNDLHKKRDSFSNLKKEVLHDTTLLEEIPKLIDDLYSLSHVPNELNIISNDMPSNYHELHQWIDKVETILTDFFKVKENITLTINNEFTSIKEGNDREISLQKSYLKEQHDDVILYLNEMKNNGISDGTKLEDFDRMISELHQYKISHDQARLPSPLRDATCDKYLSFSTDPSFLIAIKNTLTEILNLPIPKYLHNNLLNLEPESLLHEKLPIIKNMLESLENLIPFIADFINYLNIDQKVFFASGNNFLSNSLQDLKIKFNTIEENLSTILDWIQYQKIKNELINDQLESLLDLWLRIDHNVVPLTELYDYYFYKNIMKYIHSHHPELNSYTGLKNQDNINHYKKMDEEIRDINLKRLTLKLEKNDIPEGNAIGPVSKKTESALLRHEINKQKKHLPLRELLNRAGKAIQALKPCFMMSPLSVAHNLKPDQLEFDILIIDEASQMTPADALGAVLRCKQIIVVGDDMQLPPSNLFRSGNNDDEKENQTDLESILSLCKSAFPLQRSLLWHYRSRHPSLIKFSNHRFYEDRLIIPPSPDEDMPELGVHREDVDGLYLGQTEGNPKEVEAICEGASSHMQQWPERSLGIVTMNARQCDAIQEKMDQLAASRPHIANYIKYWGEKLERFFVKNLENVQGDERDIILISTVYGPSTPGGKTRQNFGDISKKAGHRRLNVLFTRAKYRLVLFTSLKSNDIKNEGGLMNGGSVLKDYIDYSKDRKTETGINTHREPDSMFEVYVINSLKQAGYDAVPQVGVAGFRIDIGVRDPRNSNRYLVGIECDGASYHSSRSARDRDITRQKILEGHGWNIYRIWSTDWFRNTRRETEKLIAYLEALQKE